MGAVLAHEEGDDAAGVPVRLCPACHRPLIRACLVCHQADQRRRALHPGSQQTRVLRAIQQGHHRPIWIAAVAQVADLDVHRALDTLRRRGLVQRTGPGRWEVTP